MNLTPNIPLPLILIAVGLTIIMKAVSRGGLPKTRLERLNFSVLGGIICGLVWGGILLGIGRDIENSTFNGVLATMTWILAAYLILRQYPKADNDDLSAY